MFELPENLSDPSLDIDATINQALDAWNALGVTPESDEETIVQGEALLTSLKALRAEKGRRARAASLIESMSTPTEPDPEPEPETPEAETPETPAEPEVLVPDEVISPEPVAASGTRPSPARRAAANASPPAVPRATSVVASLTAAADVPGFATGSPLDGLSAAAAAVINRWKAMPTTRIGGPDGIRQRYGAALIRKEGFGELAQAAGAASAMDDMALIATAGDERRLPGNSLTAAGGWCSPSETLYDLCQYETVQGILDLPEISIARGGIRWTPGPDFADIYTACGFSGTEAEAIAGTMTKDCCEVDCPDFDEIRADPIGLCVKAPLLTQATYPELVRRFMEGALVAHQHKVNKFILDQIVAAAGTASVGFDAESTSLSLSSINLAALGMRYSYRMGDATTIEVIAPYWLKEVIKEDLGMRQMAPDVSDAAINAWFTQRNLTVQWVFDLQDPTVTDCLTVLPTTATVLLYPAGTWVKGTIDVINIDAVYDSTGLSENTYTALFLEEGVLAVQRCTRTCAISIPVCISGRTAANDVSVCVVAPVAGP